MNINDALRIARRKLADGRFAEADELSRRIAATIPEHAFAHRLCAAARLTAGDPAGALRRTERALALMPGHGEGAPADAASALIDHALALLASGRATEAVRTARRATTVAPHFAPAHFVLGRALAAVGERSAGAAARARALASIPPGLASMEGIEAPQIGARFRIHAAVAEASARGAELRVVLGGYWGRRTGWLILDEADQDPARPLDFADASVDALFLERGIERLEVGEAVGFLREAFRVLKTGGTLRIVSPMLERLTGPEPNPAGLVPHLPEVAAEMPAETAALEAAGVAPAPAHLRALRLNALLRRPDVRFLWSAALLSETVRGIGFAEASVHALGDGRRPDLCLERSPALLPFVFNPDPAFHRWAACDPEALAVEAVK